MKKTLKKKFIIVLVAVVTALQLSFDNVVFSLDNDEILDVQFSSNLADNQDAINVKVNSLEDSIVVTGIELPSGSFVQGSSAKFLADSNGSYSFIIHYNELVLELDSTTTSEDLILKPIEKSSTKAYTYQVTGISVQNEIESDDLEDVSVETITDIDEDISAITDLIIVSNGFTFNQTTQTIVGYSGDAGVSRDVIIPTTIDGHDVLHIGNGAFVGQQLTSLTIASDSKLISIGERAFVNNPSMTGMLDFPNTLTTIGAYAFENTNITSVNTGSGLTSLGAFVFNDCDMLESVHIEGSLTTIPDSAFNGASALISLILPDTVNTIGTSAFSGISSLTNLTLPSSLTTIGNRAFSGATLLRSLEIPSEVTTIGNSAFSDLTSLTSLVIPNSVTTIGESTFSGLSGLTSLTIGSGINSIPNSAFNKASSLVSLTIPNNVTSIGNSAFTDMSSLTNLTLSNSLRAIGLMAFGGASALTRIDIPSSVNTIGANAFLGTTNLTAINIPDKKVGTILGEPWSAPNAVVYWQGLSRTDDNNWLFDEDNQIIRAYLGTALDVTLTDSVEIGGTTYNVNSFASEAFSRRKDLTSINIQNTQITTIPANAFKDMTSLTNVIMPTNITGIGNFAFSNTGITEMVLGDQITSLGEGVFSNSSKLKTISLPNNSSFTVLPKETFIRCSALESIDLENTQITTIARSAFQYCHSLKSVKMKESKITEIHRDAFADISSRSSEGLGKLELSNKISAIGPYAFHRAGITEVEFPTSLISLGERSFGYNNMTSIVVPSTVQYFGNGVFIACLLTSVALPTDTTYFKRIPAVMFSECINLKSITIPEGVTAIGNSAFSYSGLEDEIVIPTSVNEIGQNNFLGTEIKTIRILGKKADDIKDSLDNNWGKSSATVIWDDSKKIGDWSFDLGSKMITKYHGNDAVVILPETLEYNGTTYRVKKLSNATFNEKKEQITSLTISTGINVITKDSFKNMVNLTSINLPNSIKTIEKQAFSGCVSLESIVIPDSVTSIGNSIFNMSNSFNGLKSKLSKVTLSKNIKTIPSAAFQDCVVLESIIIPEGVTRIDDTAFSNSGLTSLNLPSTILNIGASFLSSTNVTSITIPNSAEIIDDRAFDSSKVTEIHVLQGKNDKGFHANQPWRKDNVLTRVSYFGDKVSFSHEVTKVPNEYARYINLNAFVSQGLIKEVLFPNGDVYHVGDKAFGPYQYKVTSNQEFDFIGVNDSSSSLNVTYTVLIDDIGIPVITGSNITATKALIDTWIGDKEAFFSSVGASALVEGYEEAEVEISDGDFNEILALTSVGERATVTIYSTSKAPYSKTATREITVTLGSKTLIPIPQADPTVFYYTGTEQTYNLPTSSGYNITGDLKKTDVGISTIIVSLEDPLNTAWSDNSVDDKTYLFEIKPRTIVTKNITSLLPAPVIGKTKVTSFDVIDYSANIVWSGTGDEFLKNTVYTATITLTPKVTYSLEGLATNSFVHSVADSVTNAANSNQVTVVFPITTEKIVSLTDLTSILTAPSRGAIPTKIMNTLEYTGTVDWIGNPTNFAANTAYSATINLTAKTGYTFEGLKANSFKHTAATRMTNQEDSGEITITFQPTNAEPTSPPSGGGGSGSSITRRYLLRFDTNGGEEIEAVSLTRNSTYKITQVAVKDGFIFEGWYLDSNLEGSPVTSVEMRSNRTIYAKWREETLPIVTPEPVEPPKPDIAEPVEPEIVRPEFGLTFMDYLWFSLIPIFVGFIFIIIYKRRKSKEEEQMITEDEILSVIDDEEL